MFDKKLLKIFLYWMTERHNIHLKKEAGDPWPWTKDKILQEYKFTNPFRQNDRVTKELIECLNGTRSRPVEAFTRIVIFRMFNWPFTYIELRDAGLVSHWNEKEAVMLLNRRQNKGNKIFTGAYMMTGSGSDGKSKHVMYCKAISSLLKDKDNLVRNIVNNRSLQHAVELLTTYPMVGNFIAYELVTDMRHTKILNKATDIFTWANPGPGAKRGVHRLLFNTERGELPKGEKVDYQDNMQILMMLAQKEFGEKLNIEMRDIEHSLCEFDKYCRVKFGEGRPRSKYRGGR